MKAWLSTLRASKEPPTAEQDRFLQRVVGRCCQERAELSKTSLTSKKERSLSEPVRDCLFGLPGAGKSTCIKKVRHFFEHCLGWEDGVQFQFLASQNTMAALIGGATVHSWGAIPVNAMQAGNKATSKSGDGDIDQVFLNALGIRWLILDEASTLSPALLGLLDAYLRRACERHPYALRGRHKRPFGGINIVFAGDLWQLPPVKANAIFSNPFLGGHDFEEQKIFKMFWTKDPDSIQQTFVLTQSMRTVDPWLQAVLHADRYGEETWEMYCFTHGLPTRNPGSWMPDSNKPTCGNKTCLHLAEREWPLMWARSCGALSKWNLRVSMECMICATERARRCCIIDSKDPAASGYMEEPFASAPFVHPFRHPSYHAQQLRTVTFAKANKRRLLWMTAHDAPAAGTTTTKGEKHELRKDRWLEFHDRFTSGIPGVLPLVLDLPIRFTESPNRLAKEMGVFKNSRGRLRGWELPPEEEKRLAETTEAEVVLKNRPLRLFLEVDTATKHMPTVDGVPMYTLTIQVRTWSFDGHGKVKVLRYGFPIVPDWSGTAHAYCGSNLEACMGDLLHWTQRPRKEDALKAYIIKSRVRDSASLVLMFYFCCAGAAGGCLMRATDVLLFLQKTLGAS